MATLVFTALGTALGGPLGGALGSLVGSQLDRAVLRRRLLAVVDEHAVRADVLYPVRATAILDLAVMAGYDPLRVGQDPVVVRGAPDAAAVNAEYARAQLAELTMLVADDSQFDGHGPKSVLYRIRAPPHGLTLRRVPCNMPEP